MSLSIISFVAGTTIQSTQVNANFSAIVNGAVLADGSGTSITGLTPISNGGGFKGNSDNGDRIGIATYSTNDVDIVSKSHTMRVSGGGQGGTAGGVVTTYNGYYDGTNDRYLNTTTNPGAYQLVISSAGVRVRKSTDASPTAGNTITWGAFTTLFS